MTDPSNAVQSLWMRNGDDIAPQERLRRTVAVLTRARRLQVLVDHAFAGLACGLAAATVAVLLARLMSLPYMAWQVAVASLAVALAVALFVGWRRRPDALEVAIRADLALKLKQRLSTAWEFMTVRADPDLVERLAAQVAKARLPARPGLVFPLTINRWGRFAPLAATALLLVSVLDLSRIQLPAPRAVDERVVEEGSRLRAVARELQARAAREKLSEAAKHAEQLERIGARMESGALARSEALAQLRQLRKSFEAAARQALAEAKGKNAAHMEPRAEQGAGLAQGQSGAEMLDRLLRALPEGTDARALGRYMDELAQAGVPMKDVEERLKRQAGDKQAVQEIMEQVAQIERARKEQELMHGTSEQLRRAQEILAESYAMARGGSGARGDMHDDEGDEHEGDRAGSEGADRRFGETSRGASRFGKQSDSSVAGERSRAAISADAAKSGLILKPQGQVRAGEELVTHGQVLPRPGRPSVEDVPMSAEFRSQVEAVLSKEQYPAHSKEFIRRYFLSLSQGAQDAQQRNRGAQ